MTNVTYDSETPVLVPKIGRYFYHAGGLGIIRSLGRVGVPVFSVCEDDVTPAALSKYLCGKYVWPTSAADLSGTLAGIEAIGRHLGRRAILVPTDDISAILIAENAAVLESWFLFPRQPPELPRILANKRVLYALCAKLGVACPKTYFPQSSEELRMLIDRLAFPVVVKRAESWRPADKGVNTTEIVRSPERLDEIYTRCGAPYSDLLLQEYIPDEYGQDWVFHGYANHASDCMVGFTGVKLRSYPAHAGITTFGRSIENERLRHEAEAIIKALSYRGIMDLDYRFDRRDGEYKLLDFNPRIGAQFRQFQDEFGLDVVRALHLDLTGRSVPQRGRSPTRHFIVENFDVLASARYIRSGDLAVADWLKSLRMVDEAAFFARDDLLPFFAMGVRFVIDGVMRSFGVRRGIRAATVPRFSPGRGKVNLVPTGRDDHKLRLRRAAKHAYNMLRGIRLSGPLILEYHCIADPPSDPWALCVTPRNFGEQLEVLRRYRTILPLRKMVRDAQDRTLKPDAVAITFDDGYRDVLHAGGPLLEKAEAPATVFLTTGYIGGREFWWDELQSMLLFGRWRSPTIRIESLGQVFEIEADGLATSAAGRGWRAWQEPPTQRHAAYLALWRYLRVRPAAEQDRILKELRSFVEYEPADVADRQRSLTWDEVGTLARNPLIEVGAHSVTHPSLSAQPQDVQRQEIRECKAACETFVEREVLSFAYPYGDFSRVTAKLVSDAGFSSACSTRKGTVRTSTDLFALPRIAIGDWDGDTFARLLYEGLGGGAARRFYEYGAR